MAPLLKALRFTLGTLLSRITGLAREIILARFLGAGALLDAFYVAFRIPHLLRDMLAEGALGSSFTKNYATLSTSSPHSANTLALHLLTLTFSLTSLLCVGGIFFRKELVFLMTSHTPKEYELFISTTQTLTALFLPFMIISSCGAIISGVLYQKKRFFLSSCSPIFLNLGTVLGAILLPTLLTPWLSQETPFSLDPLIFCLAIGTLCGGILQLLWLWVPVAQGISTASFPKITSWHPQLGKVYRESLPMMLAAGLAQLQLIINTNFATSLEAGSTSWLNLAFRIFQLPVGLFAVAIATTLLPSLAVNLKEGTQEPKTNSELSQSLQWTLWIMSYCATITFLQAPEIITLLFYGGSFDAHDTLGTSLALQAYAPGIIGLGATKVLLTYYYSTGTTTPALKISAFCLLISTLGNIIFIRYYAHVGLAAVMSAVMCLQALALSYKAFKDPHLSRSKIIPSSSLALITALSLCALGNTIDPNHSPFLLPSKREALLELITTAFLGALIFSVMAAVFYRVSPKKLYRVIQEKISSKAKSSS